MSIAFLVAIGITQALSVLGVLVLVHRLSEQDARLTQLADTSSAVFKDAGTRLQVLELIARKQLEEMRKAAPPSEPSKILRVVEPTGLNPMPRKEHDR